MSSASPGGRVRVALVFGGASPEHEVSLVSARGIATHADPKRLELVLVGVDRQGVPRLGDASLFEGGLERGEGVPVFWPASPEERSLRAREDGAALSGPIDVVFPIIHGAGGEDGALQGLCRFVGLPCVGSGVLGSALAMDKDRARRVLERAGIPVVEDLVLRAPELEDLDEASARVRAFGLPAFVKPARAGSSVGITRVLEEGQVRAALEDARRHDTKLVVERAVPEPREIEIAVLGNERPEASVPGEIEPSGAFYDYRAKYEDPASRLHVPAPIDDELAGRLRALALEAFVALELSGLARVDFLLSRSSGELVLNEVNTLPGFTPISMYPRLWEASGVPYHALITRLVELALERGAAH